MAKDPAFLFYPGDYLRDTQCLSEAVQVAYDRIMCEHMRNICISQQQLNFFTKKLNDAEKQELLMVLTKTDDGYQITWVAESISKRRSYSKSRSENRKGKGKNICKSYDKHMEIENENIPIVPINSKIGGTGERPEFPHHETFNENLPEVTAGKVRELFKITQKVDLASGEIHQLFEIFKVQNLTGDKHYRNNNAVFNHFFNWAKTQNIKRNELNSNQPGRKPNADDARKRFIEG